MVETLASSRNALLEAFSAHEREERLNTTKVGCFLVITLMPAGSLADYFVYPNHLGSFFQARLICASIGCVILGALLTHQGKKCIQYLGAVVPLLPVVFLGWMIAKTEGFESPYYAALNLVLLAVGAVLRWTFLESIIAVVTALVIYLAAGWINGTIVDKRILFNNFYFIALMDLIVVVGTYFQSQQRFREFALRFELDQNKAELEESHKRLVELDQAKSRFFANISHELRTPLTLLLAPLENLLNRFRRSVDEQTAETLSSMHANGMRLLKLINDLLDLVRLDSGVMQVRREPMDLGDFIRGLASAARQMAEDKRIRLETDIDETLQRVMVDRDKLEKCVLNLQFNALKFTPAGGQVTIRCRHVDEKIIIEVADTGMGIAKENLAHAFNRFWQADDSSRRKYQGVGIGLSLVKELMEVQGGTVDVDSEVGKGTIFTITFPHIPAESPTPATGDGDSTGDSDFSQPEHPGFHDGGTVSNQEWLSNLYRRAEMFPSMTSTKESVRQAESNHDPNAPKLLVADDEPDMLKFIKSQLESHYQVVEAVDGQQAINKASQFLPDIILLDMMMPEKDGLQACKEIREQTTTRNIPIILLTARADEETKLAALEAGASDFLPKPFSSTELHVRIRNLVNLYQYQRNLSRQKHRLESTIELLKETETKLVENEKLASLGRMSAGIIHEINNPLNFVSTGLFTLRKMGNQLQNSHQTEYIEVIQDIEVGINRVKTIVSDLRSFSHHENQQYDLVPVKVLIDAALRFLSHEWSTIIQLEVNVPDHLTLHVNKNRMIQVIVNLAQNAIDSMKEKVYEDQTPKLILSASEENERCVLSFWDNGTGISPEVMDKIFDPFFTTKDVGKGMGLGLSICYSILQDFEGRVSVDSEPGQYCHVKLDFPMHQTLAT